VKPVVATIDFETRSACDLLKAGAYIYARHPTTQVLCLHYKIGDGPTKGWHRAHPKEGIEQSPFPQDLADHILAGGLVEAHNAAFEMYVWEYCFTREYPEFPKLIIANVRCSAAKGAQFALPRSLEMACEVMRLPVQKQMDGKKIMLQVSKPRRAVTPDEVNKVAMGLMHADDLPWDETPDKLRRTWTYCGGDVDAEHCLSGSLREMSPKELELWQMDIRMNSRGVQCDVPGVNIAIDLADKAAEGLNGRLREITDGAVPKGSSRVKFKGWVAARGVPILNTQGEHLQELLGTMKYMVKQGQLDADTYEQVSEAIGICIDVNQTSTSKYKQMLEQVWEDGRIRDMMLYYGAARTGRWSGKGVQPHNFLRGFSKEMEFVWQQIMLGDNERLAMLFGSAMKALAKATRGALIAAPGRHLMVADYAAIEARVLLWLAEDEEGLGIFRRDEDIYLKMAHDIYEDNADAAEFIQYVRRYLANPKDFAVLAEVKKKFPTYRQLGKKAVLGLGYQMGAEKFDDECEAEGIDMPRKFYHKVVRTYREVSFPLVASLWEETENAAVSAVQNPGTAYDCRMVRYKVVGSFLHCRLPSGRLLSYMEPTVSMSRTVTWAATSKTGKEASIRVRVKPNEPLPNVYARAKANARLSEKTIVNPAEYEIRDKPSLFFSGMDQKTKQWTRMPTYGGSLVENNTQATARDFMGEAMLRCDKTELYDMLLSVHDELIAEVDEDKGDVKEFEHMMAALPEWVPSDNVCPIAAEGWRGVRYRK
jgi:DNA polymerase